MTRDMLLEYKYNASLNSYPMEHRVCDEEIRDLKMFIDDRIPGL